MVSVGGECGTVGGESGTRHSVWEGKVSLGSQCGRGKCHLAVSVGGESVTQWSVWEGKVSLSGQCDVIGQLAACGMFAW